MDRILTVPFHLGDLIKDTYEMDAAEFGAYMRLLIAHYNLGKQGIPDDDRRLAKFAGCSAKTWARVGPVVREKFIWSGGFGIRQRVLKEIQHAEDRSSIARANALKRKERDPATAKQALSQGDAKEDLTISHKPLAKVEREREEADASSAKKVKTNATRGERLEAYLAKYTGQLGNCGIPRSWGEWAVTPDPATGWAGVQPADIPSLFANFRDYWRSVGGAKATKLDWEATWRNSCRNRPQRSGGGPRQPFPTAGQRNARALVDDLAGWAEAIRDGGRAAAPVQPANQPEFVGSGDAGTDYGIR